MGYRPVRAGWRKKNWLYLQVLTLYSATSILGVCEKNVKQEMTFSSENPPNFNDSLTDIITMRYGGYRRGEIAENPVSGCWGGAGTVAGRGTRNGCNFFDFSRKVPITLLLRPVQSLDFVK